MPSIGRIQCKFAVLTLHNVRTSSTSAPNRYSTVGIGGFLPLLLQSTALAKAHYPDICANVIRNATLIAATFPLSPNITSIYYLANFPGLPCDDAADGQCHGDYCKGLPTSTSECRMADGTHARRVP
jgi:hypothetical protein